MKRRLGRTNFEASIVGFGGIPIQRRSMEEGVKIVQRAIEMGVNFIDTARAYEDSEDKIGEAIQGCREGLLIATKSHFRTKEEVAENIEESLRRLKIDRIDLLQIHSVDSEEDLARCLAEGGALEAMKESRRAGKVDYIGISGHQPPVLIKALKTGEFDTVLARYNLIYDEADKELFALAQELDVGIIVMKPLEGGSLAIPQEAVQLQVADRATSTAEAALRFTLSNPRITTVIPGMGTIDEVQQDVPFGYVPQIMSAEEKTQLQERARQVGFTFCTNCGYCLPLCPNEINIPEVFKLQVFYEQYGMKEYAREVYQQEHEAKVALCVDCTTCMERCPVELDIPTLLKEAHALLGSRATSER